MMTDGPADQARVTAHDKALPVRCMVSAQEVGGDHRRHETGNQKRNYNGNRHGKPKLAEILPGDPAHEADRRKDRNDRECDRNHGEADLVGGFERCAVG